MNNELIKRTFSGVLLFLLSLFVIIEGNNLFNFFIIIIFLISIYEWNKISKIKKFKYPGIVFLIFAFYSIYKIRNGLPGEYVHFIFILLICISTDIGGFVFGKTLKGPKLTKISPNKTYSGVFGSYLFSIVTIYFYLSYNDVTVFYSSFKEVLILTLLICTISQIGDLIISFFKRLSNIKDTGKLIPGHGGMLDRIDGMIFAFPFSYLLILLNLFKI